MLCRECNQEMYIDTVDKRTRQIKDIYYNCDNCDTSVIVTFISNKAKKQRWHTENNNVAKDTLIVNGKIVEEQKHEMRYLRK